MSERLSYPVEVMSKLLLLTPRRIQQLANDNIIIKTERGRYDLIKSVQGYIEYLNEQIPNKSSGENSGDARADANIERAKLLKHKAELARLEEEEKKGLLVNAEAEKKEVFKLARVVRNGVLSVPARISQNLANEEDPNIIYRLLEAALIEILTEIADLAESGDELLKENDFPDDAECECYHWHWFQ